MSYSGEVTGALIAAPLVIGVGAVALTAAGTAKIAKSVGSAVNEAAQTVRIGSIKGQLSEMTKAASEFDDELSVEMEAASQDSYRRYEETVVRLEEEFRKEPDTAAFMDACREARSELDAELTQKRRQIQDEYVSRMNEEMRKQSAIMNALRRETEESVSRISDDLARKEKARELAAEALAQAYAMIEEMKSSYGELRMCRETEKACRDIYERAMTHMEEGLFQAALTEAYSVKDTIVLRVSGMMEAQSRNRQAYIDTRALLETIIVQMEQMRQLDKAHGNEFTFDQTRSGEPMLIAVEDFSQYYRGAYQKLEERVQQISQRLCSEDFRDMSQEDISDAARELSELQNTFLRETSTAYERLNNELVRKETAKLLYARYKKKGYQPIPLSDEDMKVSAMDAIILRLEHKDTGERVYLNIKAVPDSEGHITMNVDIEDHSIYTGNDDEVEKARAKEREENCEAIRRSNAGKGLQLRHRCTNPGVLDTFK